MKECNHCPNCSRPEVECPKCGNERYCWHCEWCVICGRPKTRHERFLVMQSDDGCYGYYGIGTTRAEAVKQYRSGGGDGRKRLHVWWFFSELPFAPPERDATDQESDMWLGRDGTQNWIRCEREQLSDKSPPLKYIREPAITGNSIIRLMRRHKVTIRDLAKSAGFTQKRIREVRRDGLLDRGSKRDWIQVITGKDPGVQ